MKQTIKLSLIYFKEQILSVVGQNKKSKQKALPTILLLLTFLTLAIGYSIYNIGSTFNAFNTPQFVLIIGLLLGVFIALMVNLNDTQGTMFKSRDYDLLLSLPIKSVSIISAKYLSTYLVSLLYTTLISLPTFVVYFIFNKITALSIIFCILSLLFIPAFGQFISCFLGWLISLATSKMKNKNIVRTIFSIIMTLGLAVVIALANNNLFGGLFENGIPTWFKIVFSPIYFLFVSIVETSILYFLYSLLCSLGFIALGIGIITIGYKKINTSLNTTKIKGKPKKITYNQNSTFKNLLKKEATTFVSSPVYCVNGVIGLIMSFVCTIIALTTMSQLSSTLGDAPELKYIFTSIMVFCIAMCLGIAPTTSVSISMEGTKLQTLKSLPIKFKDIVLSKCALNLILNVVVIVLNTIIFCALAKVEIALSIIILFYLLFSSLTQTLLGLLLNLKYPRLNWTSETQAVKGGASMLLTMFIDMLLSILPMVLFLVLLSELPGFSPLIFMICTLAFQIIYATIIIILFVKFSEKLFKNIQV